MTTRKHYALNKYLLKKGGVSYGKASQPNPQPAPQASTASPDARPANPAPPKETVDKKGG